jgi:hypothetical protein
LNSEGLLGEEVLEETLAVAIYHTGEGGSQLYDECTQPLCHLKIEEAWFPVFCDCGHTFIVPAGGATRCVRCGVVNPIPDYAAVTSPVMTYRSKVKVTAG